MSGTPDEPREGADGRAMPAAAGAPSPAAGADPSGEAAQGRPFVERRRGHPMRETLAVLGGALLAFVVGLAIFNRVVMPRLIHSGGEVRVPDLQNLTLEQAEKALKPAGLTLSRSGERFEPSVPRGFIIAQDPAPDTPVRGNRRVLVTISLGEEFSSVPELFGQSRRGAQLLLKRAGLRIGGSTRAPSDDVGQDLVAGSDPPAETVLPRGTAVALLTSTGPGPEVFVMPDLTGREISGVRRQLEGLGFRVLVPPAAASVGPIVSQSPQAGSRVTTDVQIVLQATGRLIR